MDTSKSGIEMIAEALTEQMATFVKASYPTVPELRIEIVEDEENLGFAILPVEDNDCEPEELERAIAHCEFWVLRMLTTLMELEALEELARR